MSLLLILTIVAKHDSQLDILFSKQKKPSVSHRKMANIYELATLFPQFSTHLIAMLAAKLIFLSAKKCKLLRKPTRRTHAVMTTEA